MGQGHGLEDAGTRSGFEHSDGMKHRKPENNDELDELTEPPIFRVYHEVAEGLFFLGVGI